MRFSSLRRALLLLTLGSFAAHASAQAEPPQDEPSGKSRHERLGILLGMTRGEVVARERPSPDAETDSTLTYYDDIGPFETVTYGFRDEGLHLVGYVGYARDPATAQEAYGWVKQALSTWLGPPTISDDYSGGAEGVAEIVQSVWRGTDVAVTLALEQEAPGADTYFLVLSYLTLPNYTPPPER